MLIFQFHRETPISFLNLRLPINRSGKKIGLTQKSLQQLNFPIKCITFHQTIEKSYLLSHKKNLYKEILEKRSRIVEK